MRTRLREVSAVVAAAMVIAAIGVWTMTPVGPAVVGRLSALWLCAAAALCGALLSMTSGRGLALMIVADALAVVIFGGLRCCLLWARLSEQLAAIVSFWELAFSDYVTLYVAQRGGIVFLISAIFGILGAVLVPWQAEE
jgi:hypothetical protein